MYINHLHVSRIFLYSQINVFFPVCIQWDGRNGARKFRVAPSMFLRCIFDFKLKNVSGNAIFVRLKNPSSGLGSGLRNMA